jgi:membrane protein implicated in regulation of membrane protease activity
MATVSFWVFPWRITLVIVLAIVALILGALYLKKRKKDDSKKPQEAEVEPVATPTEQVK